MLHYTVCRRELARIVIATIVALLPFGTIIAQTTAPKHDPQGEIDRLKDAELEGRNNPWVEKSGEEIRWREAWFEFQRRYPYDQIPAGVLFEALRQVERMQEQLQAGPEKSGEVGSALAANEWFGVGPINSGGRVRAFAIDPGNPETLLLGACAGGVWKSTNGGSSWRPVFDQQAIFAIGALAYDPANTNIVYAGTGELRPAVDLTYTSNGIYKSTDGGETWTNSGLNNVGAINKIAVNSRDPNIIYVITGRSTTVPRERNELPSDQNGFYRSTDGGQTWTRVQSGAFYDMVVNPQNNDLVYISGAGSIMRSTNAGASFSSSNSGINVGSAIRTSLAIAPTEPTLLYALHARRGSAYNIHLADIYASTNGGVSWTLRSSFDEELLRHQGDYNNCISVFPNDPDVLMIGGIDLWRSTDGGLNWSNVSNWGQNPDPTRHHADQHVIVFDQNIPEIVYVGNDGGLYQSLDAGLEWKRLHNDLPITQFYSVGVSQVRPYQLIGGAQDNFTQGSFGGASFDKNWRFLQGGDGFGAVIDGVNPDFVYQYGLTGDGSRLRRINVAGGSPGDNRYIDALITETEAYWVAPVKMSLINNKLYTGRQNLFVTDNPRLTDGLPQWTKYTPGNARFMSALALSPLDEKKIIIGSLSGEIRVTTDGGANWQTGTGTPGRFVTDLVWDPIAPSRVYATFSGTGAAHIYRSDDNGRTFKSIQGNIPDMPVNAIEVDPANSANVFVGSDVGMFVSLDTGATWFPFNEGLPLVAITDLEVQRSSRTLVAATFGRSMFGVNIDGIKVKPVLFYPTGGEVIGTPDSIEVRWAGLTGPVTISLSYAPGGQFYDLANNVTGTRQVVRLSLSKTSTARIKVVQVDGADSLVSGYLTLTLGTNTSALNNRGFKAGAIAVRGDSLFAASNGGDTIYRMRLPNLTGRVAVTRSGFAGHIRGLTHDAGAGLFYALVAEADGSQPHIHKMNSSGVGQGEIPIPSGVTAVSGIAMTPDGLALVTPGNQAKLYVIDPEGGAQVSARDFAGVAGADRRGLVWNGLAFAQGVVGREVGADYPSELQQLAPTDPIRQYQTIPVVMTGGGAIEFVGLAYADAADPTDQFYFATDTAGAFYRFRASTFSGVENGSIVEGRQAECAIGSVSPNPFRAEAVVTWSVRTAQPVRLELFTESGDRVASIYEGTAEVGEHKLTLRSDGLSSGVYYLTLTTRSGARSVEPVVIIR